MTWKEPKCINYERLAELTEQVPNGLDIHSKKEAISKKLREYFYTRDNGMCYICGRVGEYGSKSPYVNMVGRHNLHHIIPNGEASHNNIVTLCLDCHSVVHNMLYILGKWRKLNL